MKISIDLVANTATFSTDLQRASKTAEREAKRMQAEFAKVGQAIGVALVAAAGGAVVAIKSVIDGMDDLSKAAQKVGIGTEVLSGLAYAADLSGVSFEALTGSLAKFNRQIVEAASGSKAQAEAFASVGVSLADLQSKSPEELLLQVSDAFANTADGAIKTAAAIAIFGKSGAELIPFLNEGRAGIKELTDEAGKLGIVINGETAKAAEEFNDNLSRLQTAAKGLTVAVASELLPALVDVTNGFVDFIKSASDSGALTALSDAIVGLITNLDTLAVYLTARLAFAAAAAAIGAFTAATSLATAAVAGLNAVMAVLGGPVGLLALAAAAVYYFATSEDHASVATKRLKEAQDSLNGQSTQTQEAALANAKAIREETLAKLESLRASAKQSPFIQGIGNKAEREEVTKTLDALDYQISELELRLAGEFLPAVKSAEGGITGFTGAAAKAAKESTAFDDGIRDAVKTLGDLDSDLRDQIATFGMGEEAVLAYRLSVGDLSDEVARAGPLGEEYAKSIKERSKNLQEAKSAQDAFNTSLANQRDIEASRQGFERQLSDIGAGPAARRFSAGVNNIQDQVTQRTQAVEDRRNAGQIDQGQYEQQLQAVKLFQTEALAQWDVYWAALEAKSMDFSLGFNEAFESYADSIKNLGTTLGTDLVGALDQTISRGADLAASAALWGEGGSESVKQLGRDLITSVVSSLIKVGLQYVTLQALQLAGIGTTTAAASAAAGALAGIWAPAAVSASIATLGGASAAGVSAYIAALASGAAASTATSAVTGGGAVAGAFADGGLISGPGSGRSDSILAKVSNGEFVMTAATVNKFGADFFDSLNAGRMPAFANGGLVGSSSRPAMRLGTSDMSGGQRINVNITNRFGDAQFTAGQVRREDDGSLTIEGFIDQANDPGSRVATALARRSGGRVVGAI